MLDRLAIPVYALVALPSAVLVVRSSVTNGLNPCEYEQKLGRRVKFVAVSVCEANHRTAITTLRQLCATV